jgi:hypothetical protein
MTAINKIYLQMLAPLLWWEKLVCSLPWISEPRVASLSVFRQLLPLVRKNWYQNIYSVVVELTIQTIGVHQ